GARGTRLSDVAREHVGCRGDGSTRRPAAVLGRRRGAELALQADVRLRRLEVVDHADRRSGQMNASRVALGVAVVCAAMGCHDTEEPLPECGEGRICTCEPGDDSPGCNPCQVGYRPALSGTACVPTCSAPDIDCGQYGVCEDTASGAECRCDPGHTGEDCTRCVAELAPNESGRCVAELSAPALLTL